MARLRDPLPALRGTVTPIEWGAVLGAWLLLALLSAGPLSKELAGRGVPVDEGTIRVAQALDWSLWAVMLPAIFRLLDRFPLRRGVRRTHFPAWLGIGLGSGVVHALLALPLIHLMARVFVVPAASLSAVGLAFGAMVRDDVSNATIAFGGYLSLQMVHRNRHERRRARETEQLLREARLHALSLQLQPHFLFNTLNGIATLIRVNPREAEESLVRLSDLLRLTLTTGEEGLLPLGEELRRLELYLALQRMRYGDRLTARIESDRALSQAVVPAMLLQPLVENALSHGMEGRGGPGVVTVRGTREGDMLVLSVEDDGVGVPPGGPAREGTGLSNCRRRLEVLYPGRNSFEIGPRAEGGTRVLVCLPYREEAAAGGGRP